MRRTSLLWLYDRGSKVSHWLHWKFWDLWDWFDKQWDKEFDRG